MPIIPIKSIMDLPRKTLKVVLMNQSYTLDTSHFPSSIATDEQAQALVDETESLRSRILEFAILITDCMKGLSQLPET